jgi:hypothetical protein
MDLAKVIHILVVAVSHARFILPKLSFKGWGELALLCSCLLVFREKNGLFIV